MIGRRGCTTFGPPSPSPFPFLIPRHPGCRYKRVRFSFSLSLRKPLPLSLFKIAGGTVYDRPTASTVKSATFGSRMDASSPRRPIVDPSDRTLDAAGMVVMPGGVDMHCHIAGPKVNVARKMMPEAKRLAEKVVRTPLTRSGTMGSVPSTFATGYKYAGMGYTTAFDAAIPPLAARHAHEEFHDTPLIDKGFLRPRW